ncbi:MAG: flagellar hook protein, partial [Desulfovibrio sp.]|nr:flagellar hook protein [Desulfovibrio sp.]
MSISISGSTALSGLSGMDTNFDTTLEQLYSVEKTQLNQLQAWKSDWQLRYDAFNTVIDQMSAAKQMLSAIGSVNSFVSKNAVSTDEKVLTALASGSAVDGQHKINVQQLASNAIWCNTGAVFESKTDFINDTGQPQTFSFDYAGKHYEYEIANNTTLESFVSLVNNRSDNPGITVSLVNTGEGYVYQVAGKSSGASNSLTIYSSGLKGMNASGSESVWSTNRPLDLTKSLTNPTEYTFTAALENGGQVSVKLKGDSSVEDLANALRNAAGTNIINPTVDSNGNLVLDGVSSITRSSANTSSYKPSGLKLSCGSDVSEALSSADPATTFNFTINFTENGQNLERNFSIASNATKSDLVNQIKQALQSSAGLGLNSGGYEISLANVTGLTVTDASNNAVNLSDLGLSAQTYEAEGSNTEPYANAFSTSLVSAKTTLTFAQSKLAERIDGNTSGDDGQNLRYTVVKKDGTATYVEINSSSTNQDLYNAIKTALSITDADQTNDAGDYILELQDVQKIFLSTGSNGTSGYTTSSEIASQINVSSFTNTGTADSPVYSLESTPNLSYNIVLNDGTTRTLTLDSPKTVKEVIQSISSELSGTGSTVSVLDEDGNTLDLNDLSTG